jgi:threonine/homoserine/homoserine lactone efflux protein
VPPAQLFAEWLLQGASAVISPGPISTAVVTAAPRTGHRTGPLISTGHALTELFIVAGLALGLGVVMQRPMVAQVIGLVGGAFLVWMGGGMLWGAARGTISLPTGDETTNPANGLSLIGLGVGATLSNPFWYIWWMTVASRYVLQARALGWLAVLVFYVGHISIDYTWNSTLGSAVGLGRRWFSNTTYRVLLALAGAFLIYLGVKFVLTALGGVDL